MVLFIDDIHGRATRVSVLARGNSRFGGSLQRTLKTKRTTSQRGQRKCWTGICQHNHTRDGINPIIPIIPIIPMHLKMLTPDL